MKAKPDDYIKIHVKKTEMFKTFETWLDIMNKQKEISYAYEYFEDDIRQYTNNINNLLRLFMRIYIEQAGPMSENEELAAHIVKRVLREGGAFNEHRGNP